MRKRTKIGLFCVVVALIALIYIDYTTNIISERWQALFQGKLPDRDIPTQSLLYPSSAPVVELLPTSTPFIPLPMKEFVRHHVVLFLYPVAGKVIRFFVIKEGIGEKTKYRAVADACEVCFTYNRGFDYKDAYFICRHCSMSYHSQRVGITSGGCNPIPLSLLSIDGALQISKEELAKVAKMF